MFLVLPLAGLLIRAPWQTLPQRLTEPGMLAALRLSLLTATLATAVCLLLGVPLAWLLARTTFPGRRLVRAVVTVHDSETTQGQNGPSTTWSSEALAEGGRAMRLPGDEAFGLADPVVVRLSSLTDRVLAVRGADGGLVKFHDRAVKAVLMPVGALAVLVAAWVLFRTRRWYARESKPIGVVLYPLVGALVAAAVVTSSVIEATPALLTCTDRAALVAPTAAAMSATTRCVPSEAT